MRDLSLRSPEYRHIQPGRVLVVAGEARRGSRGTVKPLTFAKGASRDGSGVRKPVVRLNGKRMLYCITLRPLFFRSSRPSQRGDTFRRRFRPALRRYLKECPPELLAPFAHHGEIRILAWLERPPAQHVRGRSRPRYTEEHLYTATVELVTRKRHRVPRIRGGLPVH